MSLPFKVRAVAIGDGWAGVDFAGTNHPQSFFECAAVEHDRGVVAIDVATVGYRPEVERALRGGAKVVLFQGYFAPYWVVPDYGVVRGQDAVAAANNVGYPRGATLYLDVERCGTAAAGMIIDWINRWSLEVVRAGYEAGIYVGCGQPLNSRQLYYDLPYVNHYWETCSKRCRVPVAVRGYQVVQTGCNVKFCGEVVDFDSYPHDRLGGHTTGMEKG